MATLTTDRPTLKLATLDGEAMGTRSRTVKPLSEGQIEQGLIDMFAQYEGMLDEGSNLRLILAVLNAQFRRRRATRERNGR